MKTEDIVITLRKGDTPYTVKYIAMSGSVSVGGVFPVGFNIQTLLDEIEDDLIDAAKAAKEGSRERTRR